MKSEPSCELTSVAIIGASGYAGSELAQLVATHPKLRLEGLYVSAASADQGKKLSALYPKLSGIVDLPLQPLLCKQEIAERAEIILLATSHEVSHGLAPIFMAHNCKVYDLSGAFRIKSQAVYPQYYGFEHQHLDLLDSAIYGLAETYPEDIANAAFVAVPGCYPTASLLALKPLFSKQLLDVNQPPIINAVSGVSGAGRSANLRTSFCEISLQAYGAFNHRHQPEISAALGMPVIFTPHLGNFKRGILATIYAKLAPNVSASMVEAAYQQAYQATPLVRLLGLGNMAQLQSVQETGFCDIGWAIKDSHLIISSAIDNLLKGAASQAMQCINLGLGLPSHFGLHPTAKG